MRGGRPRLLLLLLAVLPAVGQTPHGSSLTLEPLALDLAKAEAAELERALAKADWTTAETLLLDACQADPGNAGLLRALGIAHFQAGRPYPAAAALKRSDRLVPLDGPARYLLANAFLLMERRHWARAELEHMAATEEGHVGALVALARIHYSEQRFGECVRHLGALASAGDPSVQSLDLLGQCLEGLGEVERARAAYGQAIALSPPAHSGSAWPHFHLGSLLHDLGDLESALDSLTAATGIDPANPHAQFELGVVLRKSGRLEEAARALGAAARHAPSDPAIQYALAGVYRRLGRTEPSKAAMDRFRDLQGNPD